MSPKSRRPVTARGSSRASPTTTLWSLASPWITCRRRRGSAGTTSRSKRASARAGERAPPRVRDPPELGGEQAGAGEVPEKSRRAAGCSKSASARSISPSRRPSAASVSGERGLRRGKRRPRQPARASRRAAWFRPGPGTSVTASPVRVWTTRGSGRCGARASRWRERRALHRHERALAGRVHRLQHERAAVGRGQPEVVVELARQGPRPGVEPVERGRPGGSRPLR